MHKKNLKQHNIDKLYKADPEGTHKEKGFMSFKELEVELKKEIKKYSK